MLVVPDMKRDRLLVISSLLAILLMTVHISEDIARGLDDAGPQNVFGVVIFVVWLCGTLLAGPRLLGYIIMLLGGVFAAAMPVLHMRGARYPDIAHSDGGTFFVWTLFVLGTLGVFSIILSIAGIWSSRGKLKGKGD